MSANNYDKLEENSLLENSIESEMQNFTKDDQTPTRNLNLIAP